MTDENRPRIRDLDCKPGGLPPGPRNAITDVGSVAVGHETLIEGGPDDPPCIRTGVTAVLPHANDLYRNPIPAAAHVINGYGKSTGLPQVTELGEVETPLLLTNTLNAWRVADALVEYVLDRNPDAYSINPVVGECNDGRLNDVRGRHVGREHVFAALEAASSDDVGQRVVEEGVVGAGTGTTGYGWKAGIGTSSRRVEPADGDGSTVGALVLTNTGTPERLRVDGRRIGATLTPPTAAESEGGSIMMLVATDAALTSRQLGRLARRATFGLARTGSTAAHGSGDFAIAFSTKPKGSDAASEHHPDDELDPFFRATVESVEEAVLNSILRSRTVAGRTTPAHGIPIDELAALLE